MQCSSNPTYLFPSACSNIQERYNCKDSRDYKIPQLSSPQQELSDKRTKRPLLARFRLRGTPELKLFMFRI